MSDTSAPGGRTTLTIDVGPIWRGSETGGLETALGRRPGVREVAVNPVAQTATITFEPDQTSPEDLGRWVTECGYHCAGRSVPAHVCDPALAPEGHEHGPAVDAVGGAGAAAPHAGRAEAVKRSPDEVMGHGGHGEMSMAAMVADMRNRFLVAALFSIPIVLWSPIGRDVFGFDGRGPVRPARGRLHADPQPAGDLLLLLDLLHRRRPGPARSAPWT